MNDLYKCPICGKEVEYCDVAISRMDNETEVCTECGRLEAVNELEDQERNKLN